MASKNKIKYPSPGDVLWEGGFADVDRTLNAALPTRYFGGMSPLLVMIDTTKTNWQETAEKTWTADGTVFFEEADRNLIEPLANQLREAGKIGPIFPDNNADIGKPGIRSSGNVLGHDSSQAMK